MRSKAGISTWYQNLLRCFNAFYTLKVSRRNFCVLRNQQKSQAENIPVATVQQSTSYFNFFWDRRAYWRQNSTNPGSESWRVVSNFQLCRQSASPSPARARCNAKIGAHARAQARLPDIPAVCKRSRFDRRSYLVQYLPGKDLFSLSTSHLVQQLLPARLKGD
jgi:hypothetical protein